MKETNHIQEVAKNIKLDSFPMASLDGTTRNQALRALSAALEAGKAVIFEANQRDMSRAITNHLDSPALKRLKFDEQKLSDVIAGIHSLISLPDPLFQVTLDRQLDEGLHLKRVTCPIGVIGVIFESRPDALVQIAGLCLKSGNCAILKGGSEALETNRALFKIIHEAGTKAGAPPAFLTLLESHADIDSLLKCDGSIDLIIPRGSNTFVQYIMDHTRIPVMGHADGICHIYVDDSAHIDKSLPIILDAKTQYVAACNTMETLLIHKDMAPKILPPLQALLEKNQVLLKGCPQTEAIIHCDKATETDYATEYSDYILSVKIVDHLEEAINHINRYGSHHTDCILTETAENAEKFMLLVDSAGVYQNCSTRFADGFRYGFGAEVGISTGKLHARGPVGLDGLVTYKYKLHGNGQIVADYAEGRKKFHFIDGTIG
ncbi:MAG: glutamate-5-semialdehyde dehydrogenase [Anaerovorax sp.]